MSHARRFSSTLCVQDSLEPLMSSSICSRDVFSHHASIPTSPLSSSFFRSRFPMSGSTAAPWSYSSSRRIDLKSFIRGDSVARHASPWFFLPLTSLFCLVSLLAYVCYRLLCLFSIPQGKGSNSSLNWFFFAVETIALVPNALRFFQRSLVTERAKRPDIRLVGDGCPSVDVFITCCGEDTDIVLDTIRAACASDWPHDRLRIFVLDDGASHALADAVSKLRRNFVNLIYTARQKGSIKDYKAGNLNHGLWYSYATSHPPAHFVAGIDADMIVERHWLRSLIPHLLDDPNLALVCPRQLFYNIPTNDLLGQGLDFHFDFTEAVNDSLGAANCTGSGYVMRRKALEAIGGFPTASLSEDSLCSAMLLGAGWKTAYINQPLQFGCVPDSFIGHIKQRTRWSIGDMMTARKLNFRLFGEHSKHLTLRQRLAGLSFQTMVLTRPLLILGFIGFPLALIGGYPLVAYSSSQQLSWLIRLLVVHQICVWFHQGSFVKLVGFEAAFNGDPSEDTWLIPYHFLVALRSFVLPKKLGGGIRSFRPSGSIQSNLQERQPNKRAPLFRRISTMLLDYYGTIHLLFVLGCSIGIVLTFLRISSPEGRIFAFGSPNLDTLRDKIVYFLTTVGWPPVLWLSYMLSCTIPLRYALFPPTAKSRENLLERDAETGASYPKAEARTIRRTLTARISILRSFIFMLYLPLFLFFSFLL